MSYTYERRHDAGQAALRVPGLQKTVERAIHVRMRKLKREAGL